MSRSRRTALEGRGRAPAACALACKASAQRQTSRTADTGRFPLGALSAIILVVSYWTRTKNTRPALDTAQGAALRLWWFHDIFSMGSLAGGLTVWEVKLILALRRRLRRATPKWIISAQWENSCLTLVLDDSTLMLTRAFITQCACAACHM
jgi:hypothetical protein